MEAKIGMKVHDKQLIKGMERKEERAMKGVSYRRVIVCEGKGGGEGSRISVRGA